MCDYESLILAKQEAMEIYEDDPDSPFLSERDKKYLDELYKEED